MLKKQEKSIDKQKRSVIFCLSALKSAEVFEKNKKLKKSCWQLGLGCDNLIKLSRDNKEHW